jgi:hypothetical protein
MTEAQSLKNPQRRSDISQRWAGHDLVLYDAASGRLHLLNTTAATIWRMCDGTTPVEAIGRELRHLYQLPEQSDVAADVSGILSAFTKENLLEASAPLGDPRDSA